MVMIQPLVGPPYLQLRAPKPHFNALHCGRCQDGLLLRRRMTALPLVYNELDTLGGIRDATAAGIRLCYPTNLHAKVRASIASVVPSASLWSLITGIRGEQPPTINGMDK